MPGVTTGQPARATYDFTVTQAPMASGGKCLVIVWTIKVSRLPV